MVVWLGNLSEPEKVLLFRSYSIMALTVEQKAQIVKDFQRKEGDTGSSEVQVALLTFPHQRPDSSLQSQTLKTTTAVAAC